LGIGFETSRAFALAGAHVIMVNRKEEQGHDAIEKIKSEKSDAKIEWEPCDLGSLKEVKEVFTKLAQRLDRVDLLILCAGINTNQFALDADGIDRHFGVNWLGQFYVVNLLWPLIVKTSKLPDAPAPRIVFEASKMHQGAPSNTHFGSLEEINTDVGPTHLYGRTKLAMILGARFGIYETVIKPNGYNIYANAVHPGAVNTSMQQQWADAYPGLTGKLLVSAMLFVGRSPEQGSYNTIYAATSSEIEEKGYNGEYFDDVGHAGGDTSQAKDRALGQALWDLSHRLIREKVGNDALNDWKV